MNLFESAFDFDWDAGNKSKNWIKHKVISEECEETFFDPHKRFLKTSSPDHEPRCILMGKTKKGRFLFIVFTLRRRKIRVISARDMNRKEKKDLYEKATQAPSI